MSDLLGDALTMKELSPSELDDDQLAEVLEALDLDEDAHAKLAAQIDAVRPQLQEEEASAAAAAAQAAEAAAAVPTGAAQSESDDDELRAC